MKKIFTVLTVVLLGIAANAQGLNALTLRALPQLNQQASSRAEEEPEYPQELLEDYAYLAELVSGINDFIDYLNAEFPGYAELHAEEIYAYFDTVNALLDKFYDAWDAWEAGDEYVGLGAEEMKNATDTLIGFITGAEEAAKAIEDEYEADIESINQLANAMQSFNSEVNETFPGYAVLKANEFAAMTATINALNEKATAALEAAFETGVYEGLSGKEVTEANEAFIGLMAGLQETLNAITEENEADVESVNELATAYQELTSGLSESFPGYLVLKADEFAALNATIEALNDKVTAAMEAAYETGVYNGLTGAEVTEANETLMGLSADAEATATAIEDEYNQDVENVNALATDYQAFLTETEESFPGYLVANAEAVEALTKTIETLNSKVAAALENAFATGVYNGLGGPEVVDANEALIALVTGVEPAVNAIVEENEADVDHINALAKALQSFNTQIAESFPGYAVLKADEFAALNATIEALNEKATAALENAFATGVYEGLTGQEVTEANETLIGLVAGVEEVKKAIEDEYEVDVENVNALATAFEEFKNTTEAEFPGYLVANADKIEALTKTIEGLNDKINAAMEAAYETGVYEGLTGAEVTEANETLIGLVAGVEESSKAITDEYEADVESMHALATALEEFVNGTEEVFPGYLKLKAEEIAALYATIEGFNNKINAAMEAAYETGVYEGLTGAEVTEANETLMGLVAGLEETTKAIADEYEADVENVNALATALQEFNNELEYFPAFEEAHKAELTALTATVETLNNKINAAMEAAWETGVYEGLSGEEVVAANEAFMGLVAERDATLAAFEDEYDQDVENIQDLMEAFMGLQNDEKFPAFAENNEDKLADIAQALFALSQQADNSLAKAMQTGVYEGVSTKDIEAVKADIMALITAQAEDLAFIDKAYMSDLEWLESYANQVSEEDLDSDNEAVREAAGAVKQYLFELFEEVNKAYQTALNETGKYVSPMTNEAVTKIQELLRGLIVTGIDMIEAEIANGVQYYDLNGVNIKNPVSGKVYIRVANGATSKVRVK